MTTKDHSTIKVPHFKINEKTGRYIARHSLTEQQIIKVANLFVRNRIKSGFAFTDSETTQLYLKKRYAGYKQEVFACLFLNNSHELLADEIMFRGTIDRANVYPREIVRRSIELNAAAIIFCHNHPSGKAEASQADIAMTQQLISSLKLFNVRVLDHIIVGDGILSLAEKGHLL